MSDKTYVCPKCLASYQRKGRCDMCKEKLVELDKYQDEIESGIRNDDRITF